MDLNDLQDNGLSDRQQKIMNQLGLSKSVKIKYLLQYFLEFFKKLNFSKNSEILTGSCP